MNRPRQELPASATRLASPFPKNTDRSRVQAYIPTTIYDYIFRGVLAGERGAQDSIIGTFFHALYNEIARECIPTHYDPENESRVATILGRLNFRPVPTTPDPEQLQGHALDSALGSPAARLKSGGTTGVRKRAPRKAVKPTDVQGGTGGGVGRDSKKDKGQKA